MTNKMNRIAINFERATMRDYDAYSLVTVANLASGNRKLAAQELVVDKGLGSKNEEGTFELFA